ncbi:glycosyltransferase [Hymenobacter metallicola]|uniref:Glycosyltransferase n=1 Tax=Hymenobacter metallicola TaxID=2563114 RepID=A0A4Z0PZM6_9BACT|nr:glycosyltransferase [Hymenobacter metallicola]TGE23228.1 glycosyltransferase [Hymenobacter metallicola]
MHNTPAPARKNILLLIPQLTYGGAERVFHDHGQELARHHHVVECVFDSSTEVAFPTQNTLVALDVPAGAGVVGKLRSFVQRIQRVKQLKREHQIDVCISHLEGADYLNLLSKGSERVLLCIHNSKRHDPNIRGALGWLRRRVLMPWLYRSADRVVPVSRDLRQELIDMFGLAPEKVVTVNNFFDVEGIRRRSQEPLSAAQEALFTQHPVLITAGRLAREKNQIALLEVLHTMRRQGNLTAKLVLLGDGPLRADLLQQCQKLGLRSWQVWDETPLTDDFDVYFFGFQSNPFQYIARAAVSLLSSSTEGFPMALCEAMACGVPVVSTDCPTGPREILAPATPAQHYARTPEWAEFGILLPLLGAGPALEASAPIWAETLTSLLADLPKRTYYAAQAHSRVQDFAPVKIMQQWESLLTPVQSK